MHEKRVRITCHFCSRCNSRLGFTVHSSDCRNCTRPEEADHWGEAPAVHMSNLRLNHLQILLREFGRGLSTRRVESDLCRLPPSDGLLYSGKGYTLRAVTMPSVVCEACRVERALGS